MRLYKWPSIQSFHHIREGTKEYPYICGENKTVTYRPKVKLHGTNGGIILSKDGLYTQSRKRVLDSLKDNMGFNLWFTKNKDYWEKVHKRYGKDIAIFGEWVGEGINGKTAIGSIGRKVFCVFAAHDLDYKEEDCNLIVEPKDLFNILGGFLSHIDVFVIPWLENQDIEVDWSLESEDLKPCVEKANQLVYNIEKQDPFVKMIFDVDGIGEGAVYYPVSHPGRYYFSNLAFKAKGDQHATVKQKKSVQVNPELTKNVAEFIDLVCTEARLEQGAREVGDGDLTFDTKRIGSFLKWICVDIKKECKSEFEAANLEWRPVGKALTTKARNWYLERFKNG